MAHDVNPINLPIQRHRLYFAPDEGVLLRLFPSSACIHMSLRAPAVLGRDMSLAPTQGVDLTRFEAHKHGVSRRHCVLRRRDDRLTITDLGSTNGTMVNGDVLTPGQEHEIANGDHISLGTLLIAVFFSTPTVLH